MTMTAPKAESGANAPPPPRGNAIGSITMARHGRPDVDRTVRIGWRDYIDWWANYDLAGLAPGQVAPEALIAAAAEADVIFASTLPRAIATAETVAAGKPVIRDAVFVEAPLPPPHIPGRRSPGHWGVIARIVWHLGRSGGEESRASAKVRAEAAVATLTARALRGENVLLCAHGWFNRMMRPVLLAQGWRCVRDGGDAYWSFRVYQKVR
jgi:broad specificity phosphatase PhoE